MLDRLSGVKRGDKFAYADQNLSVLFADAYKVILEDDDNKQSALPMTMEEFTEKRQNHILQPLLPPCPHEILEEYQIIERDRRLKYIHTLSEFLHQQRKETGTAPKPTTKKTFEKLIELVEEKYPETRGINGVTGKPFHPAKSTLNRYWKTWISSNYNDNSVAPGRRTKAKLFDAKSEAFLANYLATTWRKSQSKHVGGHYTAYCDSVECENDTELMTVSRRTFYRRINDLKYYEEKILSPHTSPQERNQLMLRYRRKFKPLYALQRVEVDRMELNLHLIDDKTHKATERVNLYFAIDCYSRMPLAALVEIGEAENKENVVNLLRQMFISDNVGLVAKGMPCTVIGDNGSGFNNRICQKAIERLGTEIDFTPALQPVCKPFVESFNDVVRNRFLESWVIKTASNERHVGIPGYVQKHTKQKGSKYSVDLKNNARMLVSDFIRNLNEFLVEYSHDYHKEAKFVPIDAWNESLKTTLQEAYTYDDVKQAFHVFTKQDSNKLQADGTVNVDLHKFESTGLKQLHTHLKTIGLSNENPDVKVHYDTWDARFVTVTVVIPETNIEKEFIAQNVALDFEDGNMPAPISFDELNGRKPKSYGIYGVGERQVTGKFIGTVERLYKRIKDRNPPRSGQKPESYQSNTQALKSIEQRIEESNATESHLNYEDVANSNTHRDMTASNKQVTSPHSKPSKPKIQAQKTTPSGENRLWK